MTVCCCSTVLSLVGGKNVSELVLVSNDAAVLSAGM